MNVSNYKEFTSEEAIQWGMKYYGEWLIHMNNEGYKPNTPVEYFFNTYKKGIHYVYNSFLRFKDDDTVDFKDDEVKTDRIYHANEEIKQHPCPEDIVVYRYIDKRILKYMKSWSNVNCIRKDSIIFDKAFLSTTMSLESVRNRDYATNRKSVLIKIYVPKGTPCVYLDLIAEMGENELLFIPETKLKVISKFIIRKYIECIIM